MSAWQLVLLEPAKIIVAQIGQFLINVLLVIVILIIGWMISNLVKQLITKVLRTLKVDSLSDRIELDALLAKGGIKYSLSELLGIIGYWLSILVTVVVAINAIGLTIAAELLNKFVLYVPNVIAAIFVLILGMFIAVLLRNIIQTAATNAGLTQVNIFTKIVEVLVIVFAVAIALEQLNIGAKVIQLLIGIVLGSIGLAVALAFGLGCKDIAAKHTAELIERLKSKK